MEYVWYNGEFVAKEAANVSVYAHALHYGSSFFEGIRAYETWDGKTAIFRAYEHFSRLEDSAKIYKTKVPYTVDEMLQATSDLIHKNNMKSAYIRPLVFRGANSLGVNPMQCPVDVTIIVMGWGAYLGEEALKKGISCMVSSWRRAAPNTLPSLAKAGGNYLSSQLIKMEALDNGYDEGIALDYFGNVSEGSGENLFVVKDGILYTPPMASSSLFGITRNSVIQLAGDLGIPVVEQSLPREFLYLVDEVFLCGTAAEITPVSEIDKITIGSGSRGPITEKLQDLFFKTVKGENKDRLDWLTFI